MGCLKLVRLYLRKLSLETQGRNVYVRNCKHQHEEQVNMEIKAYSNV